MGSYEELFRQADRAAMLKVETQLKEAEASLGIPGALDSLGLDADHGGSPSEGSAAAQVEKPKALSSREQLILHGLHRMAPAEMYRLLSPVQQKALLQRYEALSTRQKLAAFKRVKDELDNVAQEMIWRRETERSQPMQELNKASFKNREELDTGIKDITKTLRVLAAETELLRTQDQQNRRSKQRGGPRGGGSGGPGRWERPCLPTMFLVPQRAGTHPAALKVPQKEPGPLGNTSGPKEEKAKDTQSGYRRASA